MEEEVDEELTREETLDIETSSVGKLTQNTLYNGNGVTLISALWSETHL